MIRTFFTACLLVAAMPPRVAAQAPLAVDYPSADSVFPPDMAAPTFLFRDSSGATTWRVDVAFAGGASALHLSARGEHLRPAAIDPRCTSSTNELPSLTPQQTESRTWVPEAAVWDLIKRNSTGTDATVTFSGLRGGAMVSSGHVILHTSLDPVGAPIFYRDVPLMPNVATNGVIQPLAAGAVPLINWRLRNVADASSRVVMQDMHTCANCHSFSNDGKTLGMDLDGPQNDKGLYAVVPVKAAMEIRNQDVISWNRFADPSGGRLREGFMSQVSPDGRYVVTTIKPPGTAGNQFYYVANFADYRFLQVFYPTRGILAWYDRSTGKLQPLPGADDPGFVQASAVWSPDGKYLVFARAAARDPFTPGVEPAIRANDPHEIAIQYDLYRIPFNEGRGGRAEPVAGASANGMSNSFAKVSPDGRWMVFVQARNGQLMRPDSQLFIVPATGGTPRRMRCNTSLMNSWHSFSPNGRWMVFSSKSRSPYTQMFLTHIDEQGNDTPAILIENSTASNRAVNIPEFVNIKAGGISRIDVPAGDFYRQFDVAAELARKHQFEAAVPQWEKAVAMEPGDARAHNSFGLTLAAANRGEDAVLQYRQAIELRPGYADAQQNLALALIAAGKIDEALAHLRLAVEASPESPEAHNNLGRVLMAKGLAEEGLRELQTALTLKPAYPEAHNNLAVVLSALGRQDEAMQHYRAALAADPSYADAHNNLGTVLAGNGQLDEAIGQFRQALAARPDFAGAHANLGRALLEKQSFAEAATHLGKALSSGESADLHNLLGSALAGQGRPAEALAEWRRALLADAGLVAALNQAAWMLATAQVASLRNGGEAVRLATRAVELTRGEEPVLLATLAAAYAETGRFDDAIKIQTQATDLATRRDGPQVTAAYRARLLEFQAHHSLRAGK